MSGQAGWAEVDITPPMGLEMGGRGPTETVGKKILDPLFAQVLYLKDAKGTGFVLVSLDLVGIAHELSDRIRLSIVHELGVDWNLVVINTSHTHSGPQMIHTLLAGTGPLPKNEADYYDDLQEKVVNATRAAAKKLSPVKIEVFEGTSQMAISRRGKNKNGKSSMMPNPNGPIADKLWIMKLTPTDGQPPTVVFSYACHPVIVYGSSPQGISADFPGLTRKLLREKLGAQWHFQFIQGLAGDVRPKATADLEHNRFGGTPATESLPKAANELTRDILATLEHKSKILDLNLAGQFDHPLLPKDNPPPRSNYEESLKAAKTKSQKAVAEYWLKRYDTGLGFSKGDPWEAGVIRLADNQWVCCLAGEPCVEWGPKITQWLAPQDVVMWGYCQESITYLPTDEMLPEYGYEVLDCNHARNSSPARFAPRLNETIRQCLLHELATIKNEVK